MSRGVAASSGFAPAPHTLAALKRDALNYVQGTQDDSDLNALAQRAINNAIDRINSRTWMKVVNKWTITLVADDADYGLPSDYKEPIILLRLTSGSKRDGRLKYKELKTLLTEHPISTQSGTPWFYSTQYQQRQLLLDKPPAASFITTYPTLEHWYHRRIPHLTADADKIDIQPEFERFIVSHAAATLAAMRGHQVLSFVRQEEELAWMELKADDNETQTDWSEQ